MLCIVALVVFSILAIFSAKYRPQAKEAFLCVARLFQFKPCEASFDEKVKSKVTSKLLKISPKLAKFFYKNYALFSFSFVILFFGSMIYGFYSLYLLFTTGSCDPQHPENCPFSFVNNSFVSNCSNVTPNTSQTFDFIEFYSVDCPHCRKMIPIVEKVENDTGVNFLKLEVSYNETNRIILSAYSSLIEKYCGAVGVPSFVALKTKKVVCGEMSYFDLKKFVEENK
ncbi:MAG: thioredoxin family protein [archaeon]